MSLVEDVRNAKLLGFPSYGKYMAWRYETGMAMVIPTPEPQGKKRPPSTRRYTMEQHTQLFRLWQEGKTDEQIGQTMGVSRQFIQAWRGRMRLPSVSRTGENTQKYRLAITQDGSCVAVRNDEI